MKSTFAIALLLSALLTSCSSIEDATKKWKTPESANAGLAEGEKSHYLLDQKTEDQIVNEVTTKKSPAKSKEKTKKK